jgi:hypothetical protein
MILLVEIFTVIIFIASDDSPFAVNAVLTKQLSSLFNLSENSLLEEMCTGIHKRNVNYNIF